MPTYEYACTACSHRFETRQRMTDDPITTCPECNGSTYRVLFPVGIVFKGSGFYKTDNSPSEEKSEAQKDSEASSSDDKSKTPSKANATSTKGESGSTDTATSASGAY